MSSCVYTFLAKGGFGFVLSPHIQKENDVAFSSLPFPLKTVSKVFTDEKDQNEDGRLTHDEIKNHQRVDAIDPTYKYHVRMIGSVYTIEKKVFTSFKIQNYPYMLNDVLQENIYYLNYEYGGITLYDYFQNTKTRTQEEYIHICREMLKIMECIQLFLSHDYIHHDLKHMNIVMNESRVLKVIDFGLMEHIPEYIIDCQYSTHSLYEFFPFEIEYYNRKQYDRHMDIAESYDYRFKLENMMKEYPSFFQYITTRHYRTLYMSMILRLRMTSYDDFIQKSCRTFDIYTCGLTLVFLYEKYSIPHTLEYKKRTFDSLNTDMCCTSQPWIHNDILRSLIMKMITPHVFERITIHQLLIEYDSYIQLITHHTI